MEYDKTKALALSKKIVEANNELKDYLQQAFPQGAHCLATLIPGQNHGKLAMIVGVEATTRGGNVRVRIRLANKRSRKSIRSVGADQIVLVEGGAA